MRIKQRLSRDERGQVLVLAAMFMTVLLGFAALAIDFGVMASNRRQLQNAADAAALAGAWQLPDETALAVTDAYQWGEKNNLADGEVTNAAVGSTAMANDTMIVTVSRPVDFLFGRVLGLTNKSISATATARLFAVTGMPISAPNFFPFAVWAGNSYPYSIPTGNVLFRGNDWGRSPNVQPLSQGCTNPRPPARNCNYDVGSNTFKGYFHWKSGTTVDSTSEFGTYVVKLKQPTGPVDTVDQGGNSFGTTEVSRLAEYYYSQSPIILPVINYATDNGNNLEIRIIAFVCVQITQWDNAGAVDWRGDVVECNGAGQYGGTPPPPGFPSVTVPVLVD